MLLHGLVISPYARRGFVDHQTLSFDAYLRFIEDDFLGGQRLDPTTDGRWDPRPDVREVSPRLGDLAADFDFSQRPRPALILVPHPTVPTRAGPSVSATRHAVRAALLPDTGANSPRTWAVAPIVVALVLAARRARGRRRATR